MNRDREVKREESDVSVSLQLMIVNVSQHRPSCMPSQHLHARMHPYQEHRNLSFSA